MVGCGESVERGKDLSLANLTIGGAYVVNKPDVI